ncbi:asparagine synthase-related protein [Longimicrobium terrae]|uniref:asparagine synthase (glutamine-hydrolyzing) n=1 Tax=Longimicrobium terrae TaxID=1639882 RepID=A0A841GXT6_9BACT|nr:asparagine synthase (glutamine-hydrolyzing) [Longimicrobium terrae]MBB6070565.1 asparagine synthase (glutamine-hydrolyzing) [Longimicrobium terrae]NNC29551.1 asparagine synthetase B [Longimicrobium terrae]
MSGIAGFVSAAGDADAGVLARMAAALAFRAPDGTAVRAAGRAGLAHAALRTGDAGEADDRQPFSVDGQRWIVADARIDARGDLVRALRAGGIHTSADRPAAELILHAVQLWGDGAPEHLLGDFAFVVWDVPRQRLFCARSPFGFKPFYYADAPDALVFSNTPDCVRVHPGVAAGLDEEWIADFLVHGESQSATATIHAAIRQLPAAHTLVAENGRVRIHRFWSLPERSEPLHLKPAEYAERFRALLRDAVADRLPAERASLLLSGGRDSTALAAVWRELADRGDTSAELRGYTAHHARLMPDQEPAFSAMAALALGIPHALLAVDEYGPFDRWNAAELYRPQPAASPLLAIEADQYAQAAAHSRVLLTGQGGDALLRESTSRLTRLVVAGHPLRAAAEAAAYVRWNGRLPRPGIRTWRAGPYRPAADAPAWVDADFARRVNLPARLDAWAAQFHNPPPHNLRPEAAEQLSGALWPVLGALWDPGSTGVLIEPRHPLFDLRLVAFVLSIPPAQWYNDKGLLRIAMRDRLPAPLLNRPKTPVADDPLAVRFRARGDGWLRGLRAGPNVAPWVNLARVPALTGGTSAEASGRLDADLRPLALSLWLTRPRR